MIPVILILSVWLSVFPPIGHDPDSCRVATQKESRAHAYHGINSAVWENGKGTFERNGKKCTVYTQAFNAKWGER